MSDDLANVDISRLVAPQLRNIVAVIGMPLTVRLLRKKGGTKARVPRGADAMLFARIIGEEPARNLARLFTGQPYVTLPKVDKILMEIRDREIRAAAAAGEKLQDQALKHDLTERQVLNIRRGDRGDKFRYVVEQAARRSLQADLFETAPSQRPKDERTV